MRAQFQHGHLHSRVSPKGILLIIIAILSILALISGPRGGHITREGEGAFTTRTSDEAARFVSDAGAW